MITKSEQSKTYISHATASEQVTDYAMTKLDNLPAELVAKIVDHVLEIQSEESRRRLRAADPFAFGLDDDEDEDDDDDDMMADGRGAGGRGGLGDEATDDDMPVSEWS